MYRHAGNALADLLKPTASILSKHAAVSRATFWLRHRRMVQMRETPEVIATTITTPSCAEEANSAQHMFREDEGDGARPEQEKGAGRGSRRDRVSTRVFACLILFLLRVHPCDLRRRKTRACVCERGKQEKSAWEAWGCPSRTQGKPSVPEYYVGKNRDCCPCVLR